MSSELNKVFCAILSAILVYLLASFLSELLYNINKEKGIKLSYDIEIEDSIGSTEKAEVETKLKKLTKLDINKLLEKADVIEGESFVNKNCASCHDLNMPIKNKIGPSLATILDREIGSLPDYKYSNALLNIDNKWNIVNLYYFLEKPKEWAPGTKMSYRGISNASKLLNTIKFLRDNSHKNEN